MDVRAQLLEAATKLFAAKGFDGTSLKDIADVVGIRKPSLLYHFPSKNDLRLAVLDGLLEHWNDVLPKLLMAAAGGEDRFETIVRETVGFFNEDPDRARLLMREILDRPEDMRARLEAHVAPWVTVVADYIRKGQRSGELLGDVDPEAYILQVINLIVSGVASASCLDGGLLPPESPEGDPATRHARELMRIARVSLFVEPHVSERGTSRTQSETDAERAEPSSERTQGART